MPAARLSCAALIAAALLAAGCAGAAEDSTEDFRGEDREVARTLEDYQDAARTRDEEEICNDLLHPDLVRVIERDRPGSCPDRLEDSLRDVDAFEIKIEKVDVNGTRATAVVEQEGRDEKRTGTVTLVKAGSPARWRISRIGG